MSLSAKANETCQTTGAGGGSAVWPAAGPDAILTTADRYRPLCPVP